MGRFVHPSLGEASFRADALSAAVLRVSGVVIQGCCDGGYEDWMIRIFCIFSFFLDFIF